MKAEETRLITDEQGVTRRIQAGKVIPAQWEEAYEQGEPVPEETISEGGTKAQNGPDTDKAQRQPDTTKDAPAPNPVTQAATQRRRK